MKKILLAIATAASLAYTRWIAKPLDATTWDVTVKRDAFFALSHSGTLNFADGRFNVSVPQAAGFSAGSYDVQNEQGSLGTIWSAALSQAERGVFSWQGLVRGDQIEGVAVLWSQAGKPERYVFKGTRKGA